MDTILYYLYLIHKILMNGLRTFILILCAMIHYTNKTVYFCYVLKSVFYPAIQCNVYVNMLYDTVLNTLLCLSVYYLLFIFQSN